MNLLFLRAAGKAMSTVTMLDAIKLSKPPLVGSAARGTSPSRIVTVSTGKPASGTAPSGIVVYGTAPSGIVANGTAPSLIDVKAGPLVY